jgi:hypothetical protein
MGREGVAYINLFQDIVWWWVGRAWLKLICFRIEFGGGLLWHDDESLGSIDDKNFLDQPRSISCSMQFVFQWPDTAIAIVSFLLKMCLKLRRFMREKFNFMPLTKLHSSVLKKNKFRVRFQVLTAASLKFRFVFRSMMEAARTSETSVDNYFTLHYIPEDKTELQNQFRFCPPPFRPHSYWKPCRSRFPCLNQTNYSRWSEQITKLVAFSSCTSYCYHLS